MFWSLVWGCYLLSKRSQKREGGEADGKPSFGGRIWSVVTECTRNLGQQVQRTNSVCVPNKYSKISTQRRDKYGENLKNHRMIYQKRGSTSLNLDRIVIIMRLMMIVRMMTRRIKRNVYHLMYTHGKKSSFILQN